MFIENEMSVSERISNYKSVLGSRKYKPSLEELSYMVGIPLSTVEKELKKYRLYNIWAEMPMNPQSLSVMNFTGKTALDVLKSDINYNKFTFFRRTKLEEYAKYIDNSTTKLSFEDMSRLSHVTVETVKADLENTILLKYYNSKEYGEKKVETKGFEEEVKVVKETRAERNRQKRLVIYNVLIDESSTTLSVSILHTKTGFSIPQIYNDIKGTDIEGKLKMRKNKNN